MSDRYISDRFLPDKAIDLVDEAASRLRMEIDSRPVEVDEIERAVRRLEIEEMALAKEPDPASAERLAALRRELADKREQLAALGDRWRTEKEHIAKISAAKEQLETLRREAERAERDLELEQASELRYGRIPELERQLATAEQELHALQHDGAMLKEEVGPDDIAAVVSSWTGIPAGRLMEGETAKLLRMEESLSAAGGRPARGGRRRLRRRPPGAGRHRRPGPADRLLPLPRPDRRRQDRAGQGAGRVPLRRRAGHGPHRHERVRREALGGPAGRRTARLRRVRGGRPAHRGGAPPPVLGGPARRGGEGPPRGLRRPACRCSTTAGSPTARAARSTSATPSSILTSNLGSHVIADPTLTDEQRRDAVMAVVRSHFKPEFLNRLDDIVVFHALTMDELASIVDIQLGLAAAPAGRAAAGAWR